MNFPIRDAVRRELSWTHYRLLLRVEKTDARSFYEKEPAAELLRERKAIEMEATLAGKGRKTRSRKGES
jgi:predicted nuclease of restriction endonuclease-like (RecB) superfamily